MKLSNKLCSSCSFSRLGDLVFTAMIATNSALGQIQVTSQTVSDGNIGETTGFMYDGVGQLTNVAYAEGSSLTYTYHTAHRLTKVVDNIGNSVTYTLDTLGNRTAEHVTGLDGVLTGKIGRVFDTLNNLQQITGAL